VGEPERGAADDPYRYSNDALLMRCANDFSEAVDEILPVELHALHTLKGCAFHQDVPATELGWHFVEVGSQVVFVELRRLGHHQETRS